MLIGILASIAASSLAQPMIFFDPEFQKRKLVGQWEYRPIHSSLLRTYVFREDGTAEVRSCREQVELAYAILSPAQNAELVPVAVSVLGSNGAPDCSGQQHPRGLNMTWYIGFDRAFTSFDFCSSDVGDDCRGPVKRLVGK